jgi:hypothetical protein
MTQEKLQNSAEKNSASSQLSLDFHRVELTKSLQKCVEKHSFLEIPIYVSIYFHIFPDFPYVFQSFQISVAKARRPPAPELAQVGHADALHSEADLGLHVKTWEIMGKFIVVW